MKLFTKLLLVIILLASCLSTYAGWEITYRATSSDGEIKYDVMLVEDNMVKYTGVDGGFIIDVNANEFTILFEDLNEYWKGNIADYRKEMDKAMKIAMEELMQNVPEDQREMYTQMLGGMGEMFSTPLPEEIDAINVEVLKTNILADVAGYSTQKYEVLVDGNLTEQIWLTTELDISDHLNIRALSEMFNQFEPNVDGESLYCYTNEYLDLWNNGFGMKTIENDGDVMEVIKAEKKNLLKTDFNIPERYRAISTEQMLRNNMMDNSGGTYDNTNDDDW